MEDYRFPFGEKLNRVQNNTDSAKEVFVLGYMPDAVHAKWVFGRKTICNALAVASEPSLYWDGNPNEVDDIISRVDIPKELGLLVLPGKKSNGYAGRVLDNNILKPLGINRTNIYISYVMPEYRSNKNQQKLINEIYNPLKETFGLREVTIPLVSDNCDDTRREVISGEILLSKAKTLILLGDIPIKQYLNHICETNFSSINEYIKEYGYGKTYTVRLKDREIEVMPFLEPEKIYGNIQHAQWEKSIMEGIN